VGPLSVGRSPSRSSRCGELADRRRQPVADDIGLSSASRATCHRATRGYRGRQRSAGGLGQVLECLEEKPPTNTDPERQSLFDARAGRTTRRSLFERLVRCGAPERAGEQAEQVESRSAHLSDGDPAACAPPARSPGKRSTSADSSIQRPGSCRTPRSRLALDARHRKLCGREARSVRSAQHRHRRSQRRKRRRRRRTPRQPSRSRSSPDRERVATVHTSEQARPSRQDVLAVVEDQECARVER